MGVEFQWFGPLTAVASVLIVYLGFQLGRLKGGLIGIVLGSVFFWGVYTLMGTYGPKLVIDYSPQKEYREEGEMEASSGPPVYESRYRNRVEERLEELRPNRGEE